MGFELDSKRSVFNHYGPRVTNQKFGGQSNSESVIRVAQWDFDYNDLPTYGASNLQFSFPANCTIVSAKFIVDVAFTSTSTTTDLEIGLYTSAGVAIDADGLVTAVNADQTAIAVAGKVITGTGALVGVGIGATAGELVVAPSVADLLTGAGRIIVEYVYDK